MNSPTKTFARHASTFQLLVKPVGSCIASDRITVDGLRSATHTAMSRTTTVLPNGRREGSTETTWNCLP